MLMNLKSLQWDSELCEFFNIDSNVLPKVPLNTNSFTFIPWLPGECRIIF